MQHNVHTVMRHTPGKVRNASMKRKENEITWNWKCNVCNCHHSYYFIFHLYFVYGRNFFCFIIFECDRDESAHFFPSKMTGTICQSLLSWHFFLRAKTFRHFRGSITQFQRAITQLTERSLMIPEDPGSNQVIGNFYWILIYSYLSLEKTKKEIGAANGP